MTTFEVHGPDPDGDFWVVRIDERLGSRSEVAMPEAYATAADAQVAADKFNAHPDAAPDV